MVVLNPYKPWLDAAVNAVAAGDEELAEALRTAASIYMGYTHVTLNGGVLLVIKAEAPPAGESTAVMRVYKYTPLVYAEGYRDAGVTPFMYHEVVVDYGK